MATVVPAEAISEEVRAFAAERGVEQFLDPVYDMTQRVFPAAKRIDVRVEPDPEIVDYWFVIYAVEVPGLSVQEAVDAHWQWCRELSECLQGQMACAFVASIDIGK